MYLRTLIGPRAGEILDFSQEAAIAMLNDGRAEMADPCVLLPAGVTLPEKTVARVPEASSDVQVATGARTNPGPEHARSSRGNSRRR